MLYFPDRESGDHSDEPINGRNLTRSQSFVERRQKNFGHESKDGTALSDHPKIGPNIPESRTSEQNGQVILNGFSDDHDHDQENSLIRSRRRLSDFSVNSPEQRRRRLSDGYKSDSSPSAFTPVNRNKPHHLSSPSISRDAGSPIVPKSSVKEGEKNKTYNSSLSISHLRSSRIFSPPPSPNQPTKTSSTFSSSSDSLRSVKDIHNHSNKSSLERCQKSTSLSSEEASSQNQRRFSLSAIVPKKVHVKDKTSDLTGNDFEAQGQSWIERKKRSCSLPGSSQALDSTEMEAAFSELLSAVDQCQNGVTISNDLGLVAEDAKTDINENEPVGTEVVCHIYDSVYFCIFTYIYTDFPKINPKFRFNVSTVLDQILGMKYPH